MKKLTLLLTTLITLTGWAGGVGVGNGGFTLNYVVEIDEGFEHEEHLRQFLKHNTVNLENGNLYQLKKLIKKHDCDRKLKLDELVVKRFFPILKGKISYKQYKGILRFRLQNCHKRGSL